MLWETTDVVIAPPSILFLLHCSLVLNTTRYSFRFTVTLILSPHVRTVKHEYAKDNNRQSSLLFDLEGSNQVEAI
jgi:hypothetical protein